MKKSKVKYQAGGYAGLLQQIPGIADAIIGLAENDPRAYSDQPLVNPSVMRSMVSPYANGGIAGESVIEVEDDEILQTPDGNMVQVDGKTHAEGGEDVLVPDGTKIFSDQLKVDGKTMQERKAGREKTLKRLERLLSNNTSSTPLKNTLNRTRETFKQEEAEDMAMQQVANVAANYFALGGVTGGGPNPLLGSLINDILKQPLPYEEIPDLLDMTTRSGIDVPSVTGRTFKPTPIPPSVEAVPSNKKMGLTTGDIVGMSGNLFNAIAPIFNTMNAAAATKPNVNRFLGFGQDAIDTNDDAQDIAAGLRATTQTDISTADSTARARNRNSAQGVNTLRALDAVTDMGTNRARVGANDAFAGQMLSILGQRTGLQNAQDEAEMRGQTAADIATAQDTDNYFSNMANNLVNFGDNIQGVGRALNVNKSNQVDMQLLSQLSQYGLGIDKDGNLINAK